LRFFDGVRRRRRSLLPNTSGSIKKRARPDHNDYRDQ
jgi:hypothetical protein